MDLQTVDKLLTTTRSVRLRLDFDRPVPKEVLLECLRLALQAPTGTNRQAWHFVIVTDADKRARIAEYYRSAYERYAGAPGTPFNNPSDDTTRRVRDSSSHLAENMHRVPVMVIPCYEGRVETAPAFAQASLYGSILPATWSLMMALRSRGLGSAWTTLHLRHEREVSDLLGIPENITQAALLPVAYFKGEDFKPAPRKPMEEVLHWEGWE